MAVFNILVADDNPEIHKDFKKILETQSSSNKSLDKLAGELFSSDENSAAEQAEDDQDQFQVTTAADGEEAVQAVTESLRNESPFAVAILDMRMPPGINGFEAAKRIIQQDPHVQIILCTAYSDESLHDISTYFKNSSRLLILKKPFDVEEARQAVLTLSVKWKMEADFNYLVANLNKEIAEKTSLLDNEKAQRIQESKMAALGEMAGGIAHEINNPLAVILGHSNVLKRLNEDNFNFERFKHAVDKISNNVSRITKIISALLKISRESSTEEQLWTPVSHVIEETLDLCTEKLRSNGIEIRINVGKKDPQVFCNPIQLSQVFINLLNNSCDAISGLEDKWVEIRVVEKEESCCISVIDSGPGIDPEVAEKILNPFFTTKRVGKGTGLGLSIAHSIISAHNGTLSVDSSVPNTCFLITLPNSANQSAKAS